MSTADTQKGRQSGSQVLVGFCAVVLVLFAVMLNNPEQVAEWGSKYFGWKTPKGQCVENLKQIDGAVQSWALGNKKAYNDTYSLTDTEVRQFLRGSILPVCPLGGKYTAGANISDSPRCSIPGHTL